MSTIVAVTEQLDVADMARDLRVLIGTLRRRMNRGAASGDLRPSQVNALLRLESAGPMTVTALAASEGVRPQSMGATIAALEAAGMVRGTPDPSDGRRTILALSDQARELIAARRSAKDEWLVHALRTHLTATERQTVHTAVELLKRLIDTP